jgi:hypothetical protein
VKYDELQRAFADHARFCRESLVVENERRQVVKMVLQPGQVRLREAIDKERKAGRPVRIVYLKSRRIMATTATAAEFFHATAFDPGVHTIVMAHSDDSVKEIFPIYKRFHDHYLPFGLSPDPPPPDEEDYAIMMPPSQVFTDRILWEHAGDPKSSYLQIHTAGSENFGRGTRFTNVHFSEFPYYPSPAGTMAAVMSAVPALPETSVVIEGTAKTIGDLFQKMCTEAMEGRGEWQFIFMGWWEHPGNRMPLAVSPDRFQESLTADERELMQRYNLKLEQLGWRRWKISSEFSGDMQRFRREHPATPEEAFSASSRNRFSIPHIQRMPIQRDPAAGELQSNDIGAGEQRTIFLPTENGALRIWRRPEKGRVYALGADCAQGLDLNEGGAGDSDPDWTVAQILDRDTGEQCAVLRARMMPGESGRYVAKLGRYYNLAQICGERNPGGGGVSMLEAILNADYPSSMLYHRPVTPDRDPQVRGERLGWDTSGVSRPILISALDEALRQMAILIHDPVTQRELLTFVIKASGKAEHETGCHDDCVIALALALVVIEKMPRPRLPDAPVFPKLTKYGRKVDPDDRGRVVRVR